MMWFAQAAVGMLPLSMLAAAVTLPPLLLLSLLSLLSLCCRRMSRGRYKPKTYSIDVSVVVACVACHRQQSIAFCCFRGVRHSSF